MPVNNPPPAPAASGSGGGLEITVDADGYITVPGAEYPFKDMTEDLGGGMIRFSHMIKHPTLGEVAIVFSDVQT
jgi:hypothetical protein